jgi:hypothetical protein
MPSATRLQESGTTGNFDPDYQQRLLGEDWDYRRKQTLKLAGFNCQLCGSFEPLEVHHRRYGTDSVADRIALCRFCHQLHEDHKAEKPHIYERGEWDTSRRVGMRG